ncbi:uncharacterized protein [Leptinotarsa decemlineata]|uniref:uncharacterized protein n=1 Tax=Leptinotarsa decemlineata TaxID=7539 RepID=UPI003D307A5C
MPCQRGKLITKLALQQPTKEWKILETVKDCATESIDNGSQSVINAEGTFIDKSTIASEIDRNVVDYIISGSDHAYTSLYELQPLDNTTNEISNAIDEVDSIMDNDMTPAIESTVSSNGSDENEDRDSSAVQGIFDSDDTDVDPNYSSETKSESSSQSESVSADSLAIGSLGSQQATRYSGNLQEIENGSTTKVKRIKKRKRNEPQWKKTAAKSARNSGVEYVSSSKSKKVIRAREMKPPCKESCRLNCRTKITEESHKNIFANYWALGDSQRQRDYLSSCMKPVKPKYQYQRSNSNRHDNNSFHFSVNGNIVRVCKSFFRSTLDITDRPIRTVLNKQATCGGMVA